MTSTLAEDELSEVREHIEGFFKTQVPPLVAGDGPQVDQVVHRRMAELGFLSLGLPEQHGGMGLPRTSAGLIAAAAGRSLVHGPWLDQLVLLDLLVRVAPGEIHPYATGERWCSMAFADSLVRDPGAGSISGTVQGVRFGTEVDVWCLVTPAATYVVPADAAVVRPDAPSSGRWTTHTVELVDAVPELVLPCDAETNDAVLALAAALVARFSVAAAERVVEIAVEHARDRQQFGVAIGTFQAVKHRLASCYVDLVHARSLAEHALSSGSTADASCARVLADEAYRRAAESSLQVHGGIGFTSEVVVHNYLKNAQQLRAWPRPMSSEMERIRLQLDLDRPLTGEAAS